MKGRAEGTLESQPGTYVLILSNSSDHAVRIGRLGRLRLQPGFYVYVGSALGPGGVEARVARHCRRHKMLVWHIDYLGAHARITEVWYALGSQRREHAWARAVSRLRGASILLPGFGSSDCDCPAHLFFFRRRPSRRELQRRLRGHDPTHPPLQRAGALRRQT